MGEIKTAFFYCPKCSKTLYVHLESHFYENRKTYFLCNCGQQINLALKDVCGVPCVEINFERLLYNTEQNFIS